MSHWHYAIQIPWENIRLLQGLHLAHRSYCDHEQIIKMLFNITQEGIENYKNYMNSISLYLKNNLQNSMHIINSLELLSTFHPYITMTYKKIISGLIYQKYPAFIDFYGEIQKIRDVNTNFLEQFFKLIHFIAQWIKLQIQDKDYLHISVQQIIYIINFLYSINRYQFEYNVSIDTDHQFIFILYRIIVEDCDSQNIINSNIQISKKVIHIIFYFLGNLKIKIDDIKYYKHLNYCINYLLQNFIKMGYKLEDQFVELLNQNLHKNKSQNKSQFIIALKNFIINLLICQWSIQNQRFWLWKYKLYNDLLNISLLNQYEDIVEIYELIKHINKLVEFD